MGRPAHCTCWLMGATAINQYCFLCQPFGCSCHTGVHFCFLKLAVSAAIYIYPPMKKWKSCTICTTFRHKVRMLHSAAVPPGLFEALQGWQHHLCPRLPVKVQWFCYSLILRLMLVPICSNQNVVGLVLHFFFNLSFGKHMEKKTPHSSFESAANLNPRRVTCACRGISSTGPLARTWGCCLWLGTLRKWWLIGLENSEIQPQSPWKSKPLLPLIEKPESRIRRIAKRPTATSEHMTRAVTLTYPNWLPNTCDWSVNSLAVAPFHLMVKKNIRFPFSHENSWTSPLVA